MRPQVLNGGGSASPGPAARSARGFRCDRAPTVGMLAVAGGKGGCGKTTTALGVARAAASPARSERPVVVADADRDMPDLHSLAGVARTPTLADAARRGASARAVAAPVDRLDATGVRALPAPQGVAGATTARSLSAVAGSVDVVDCPAGAGPDAAAPLRVADAVLLVARATRESLADALKTAAMARALDCDPVAAVLTRTRTVPDGVASALGVDHAVAVPEADRQDRPLNDRSVREAYGRVVRDSQRII